MTKRNWITRGVIVGLLCPVASQAQGLAQDIGGLQSVLDRLYDEMIPMCSQLIGVGRGIAGFAALWYIAHRVWKHLANAEPIDFYPLFRPFVLGFCIIIFPSVIDMINGILKPTVTGTQAMVSNSNTAIAELLQQKEALLQTTNAWQMYVGSTGDGDRDKWYRYSHNGADPSDEGIVDGIGNDVRFAMAKATYNFENSIKKWMSEVLEVLYQAAALCINTLRTFNLIVLAIMGPLVFGLAVFDGFQHSLTAWLGRYINMYLWLPIANIFGAITAKIQEQMLQLDMQQIQQQGDTFFSATDVGYLVFMIIAIVGYTTVPSVANYIVNVWQGGGLTQRITSMAATTAQATMGQAVSGAKGIMAAPGAFRDGLNSGSSQQNPNSMASQLGRLSGESSYQKDKLSGQG
jgi:conjugative transposon TraJ protein